MEVELEGKWYRTGRLNAKQQQHVARRLAPALSGILARASEPGFNAATATEGELALAFMAPIVDVLSKMSDADYDYISDSCLSVCARKEGERWAPMLSSAKTMMFEDTSLNILFELMKTTVMENLAPFFSARLGVGAPPPGAAKGQT